MTSIFKTDIEKLSTNELAEKFAELDDEFWVMRENYNRFESEIEKRLSKKELDYGQLCSFGMSSSSISDLTLKVTEASLKLFEKVDKEIEEQDLKNEAKTYEQDHVIPLMTPNPLRQELCIDERWIMPDNAVVKENSLKGRTGLISPHEKPDLKSYKELKDFLKDKPLGRIIYFEDAVRAPELYNGIQHPIGIIYRSQEENSNLRPYANWNLLYFNTEIGAMLEIDHAQGFEFGFLSIPYAKPLPDGIHRLALVQRKDSNLILEITVENLPLKLWHENTNSWLARVKFYGDGNRNKV